MINLQGLKILITRPALQGKNLCSLIQSASGEVIHFPTIEFKLMKIKIPDLNDYDWLIFISPQAVNATLHLLNEIPAKLKIATVGKGTACLVGQHGFKVDYYPQNQEGGEALLNFTPFQDCNNLKIMIIRGVGGREMIDKELSLRGAKVSSIIAYERILPTLDTKLIEKSINHREVNRVVATSYEGLKNLKILLTHCWQELKKIPLIVVSERIKKLAIELGYEKIEVTKAVSDQSILQTLAETRGKR